MKKRVCISLVATIVCIALTNKFWLTYKPINLSFTMKGSGVYNITAIFNKRDNNDFISCKSANGIFNLNEDNKISLNVKTSQKLKRLKIAVNTDKTPESGGQTLNISGLQLYGDNITDLQNFSANNADIKVLNNSLVLTPKNKNFEITYNTPFTIKAKPIFDYKFFIIIAVLSYLLLYKLTSYLADFKNVKNQSRIEIVFLTIFGMILIIPASAINNEKYSEHENRKLAEKPQFVVENEINYNFGKNFDTWFSDRFNLRTEMIKLYNKTRFILTYGVYKQNQTYYFDKHTQWAFDSNWEQKDDLSADFPVYYRNIKKLKAFCDKNHIKLYILITPVKMDIYPQYYPLELGENTIKPFREYVNSRMNQNFILYPIEELQKASETDYIFPKGDPHWSEYGAYTAYKILMNNIKKDFPDIKILNDNDFNITKNTLVRTDYGGVYHQGTEYTTLNINRLKTKYTTYQHKKEKSLSNTCDGTILSCYSSFPYGNKKKLYIIGNSFSENLFLFLKYSFNDIRKRRINNPTETPKCRMSRWESEILDFKPDILIFTVTSLQGFSELYGEDK